MEQDLKLWNRISLPQHGKVVRQALPRRQCISLPDYTMDQKPSLIQSPLSVQQVLTGNNRNQIRCGDKINYHPPEVVLAAAKSSISLVRNYFGSMSIFKYVESSLVRL